MAQFFTVREAADLTGKSPSSIRRVIYPIIKDDKHPDRHHIQPNPEEALQLRTKGENFAWRLSEELLRREFPPDSSTEKGTASSGPREATHEGGSLLAMLQRELDIKNGQIAQQGEIIANQLQLNRDLNERVREGNILIASLQKQLAPPSVRETVVDASDVKASANTTTGADTNEPKRNSKPAAEKGSKNQPKAAKRKVFFGFFKR